MSIFKSQGTGNGIESYEDQIQAKERDVLRSKREREQTQILKELVKRDREREQREIERDREDNERHKRLLESEQKAMEMSNINIKISTRTLWATIILGITSIIIALFK